MKIFEFSNYRTFLRKRLQMLPGRGRGELTRIARALDIHTTMMSHIMNGSVDFSLEQSLKLANYLAFNSLETDYLVALVQLERAGDQRSRDYCRVRVDEIKNQALDLKTRLKITNALSDEDRAIFYSSSHYAYVRLLSAIDRFQTFEALLQETRLEPKRLREILEFLVSRGLCEEREGRVIYGAVPTYIEASSPLVFQHHLNWRRRTQEKLENLRQEDLAFTYPVAMSEEDFRIVREKLVQFVEEFKRLSAPSPSEQLYCLNMEWLKISRN